MIQEKTSKDITDNKKYNYINEDIVNDLGLHVILAIELNLVKMYLLIILQYYQHLVELKLKMGYQSHQE